MRAGPLKRRAVFEAPMQVFDATGGVAISWVPRAEVFASIEPIGGREAIFGNQPLGEMDTRIRVRWTPALAAVSSSWRIRHGTIIYSIVRPPAEIRLGRREIELMCSSGVNAG